MSTYTTNDSAISLTPIQGTQGPVGYTGAAGATGAQGIIGVTGQRGGEGIIRTDISFSEGTSTSTGKHYRIIKEGKVRLVGSFIFSEQAEITSIGSTEIKVLVSARTQTGEPTEIGLVLNCNIPDLNGNTRLAAVTTTVSGSFTDPTIVTLPIVGNSLINQDDVVSLWAYIKPTQTEIDNTINYLTTATDSLGTLLYTADQVIKYKYEKYIKPYYTSTGRLWLALRNDYNTINTGISPTQQLTIILDAVTQDAANSPLGVTTPVYDDIPIGGLNVYYLQLQ